MRLKRRKAINQPIAWSSSDEARLLRYIKRNEFDLAELLSMFPERNKASINSKVRKLRIQNDLFGDSYRDDKGTFTKAIGKKIEPKNVFDAYAGAGHQAFNWIKFASNVFAADLKKGKYKQFANTAKLNGFAREKKKNGWTVFKKGRKRVHFFSGDAVDAAILLKHARVKIDVVDLDTCGSTLPTLPYFLLLLKPKHLLITHGEFHSLRFQREDVLRRLLGHKDISETPFPMDVDTMSNELDKAVKTAALRVHNETKDSFWLDLKKEVWLGTKFHGMLRRHYKVSKPAATADCLNLLSN